MPRSSVYLRLPSSGTNDPPPTSPPPLPVPATAPAPTAVPVPDGATLRALLRRYDAAGQALTCEPVTEGLLNRGYRLITTRGRYFLKHHLDGDVAAIARHHRATARLEQLGLPVAPPLPDTEGDTVAVVGGHCYALHPWVEGQHRYGMELTAGQSGRLGALLGLVHVRLAQVMPGVAAGGPAGQVRIPQPRRPEPREEPRSGAGTAGPVAATGTATAALGPVLLSRLHGLADPASPAGPVESADPYDTFALIDELLRLARGRRGLGGGRDSFDTLAEWRLIERRALLERHAHRRPTPVAEQATGWVHGDFHPLNLLYRGREPAAIIDWDRLGLRPRAEEAVRAAAIFFVRPDGTLDLAKVRPYALAYRRATGTSADEMAAAAHRVWWERLNDFWMLRWRYELLDRRADRQFPAASALSVWWTREYEAVRDAFAD